MSGYQNRNWAQNDSDTDDESGEAIWERYDTYKMGTVVVLDNSPEMFDLDDLDDDGNTYFKMCLCSCLQALEKYVFREYNHTMAISLMGKKSPGDSTVLFEFGANLLDSVQKLMELTSKSNEELRDMFESTAFDNQAFYEFLVDSVELFRKNNRYMKNSKRHIAIVTRNSSPRNCDKDDDDIERAMERLRKFQIEFVVLPVATGFCWDDFYKEIINKSFKSESEAIEEFEDRAYDSVEHLTEVLNELIHSRRNTKRTVLRFVHGDEHRDKLLHVQVTKLFKAKKLYRNCRLDPRTMTPVVRYVRKAAKREEDEQLQASALESQVIELGDSDEEPEANPSTSGTPNDPRQSRKKRSVRPLKMLRHKESLKKYAKVDSLSYGFRLLYVSDRRSTIHYLNKKLFIVQKDETMHVDEQEEGAEGTGADPLFDYFWSHCEERNKVLVCTYVVSRRQKYHLVELRPGRYLGRLCFFGQFLPSCEGIKKFRPHLRGTATAQQRKPLDTAAQLVGKLTIRNNKRPFELASSSYERKCNVLKGMLLSTKDAAWQPCDIRPYWPEQREIAAKIGAELADRFRQDYLSGLMKRKQPAKPAYSRKKK